MIASERQQPSCGPVVRLLSPAENLAADCRSGGSSTESRSLGRPRSSQGDAAPVFLDAAVTKGARRCYDAPARVDLPDSECGCAWRRSTVGSRPAFLVDFRGVVGEHDQRCFVNAG